MRLVLLRERLNIVYYTMTSSTLLLQTTDCVLAFKVSVNYVITCMTKSLRNLSLMMISLRRRVRLWRRWLIVKSNVEINFPGVVTFASAAKR